MSNKKKRFKLKERPIGKNKKEFERPLYLSLKPELLQQKINEAWKRATLCELCPRRCKAKRFEGTPGVCRTGRKAIVSGFGPHFGEEPPISGHKGSGTIFFAGCNLGCIFCQNYDTAHKGRGYKVDDRDLAEMMLSLQKSGCHNINLVSPTHVIPQILSALFLAIDKGLEIPLVYNTGGYDLTETLDLLSGVIDIYMPDMKFSSGDAADRLANAPDYPRVNFKAVQAMHRQVQDLVVDRHGIARRGLLIRHLVLPGKLAGSEKIMEFIAQKIGSDTYLNIMDQYRPFYKAVGHEIIGRRITQREYNDVLKIAENLGLTRVL